MKQKLFRSLLLLTMGSVLLVVALFAWFSVHYITTDSYQSLKREAALLLETDEDGRITLKQLQRVKLADRVTLLNPKGEVLFDNYTLPEAMDNHLQREEVQQALEQGEGFASRKSDTLGKDILYYAVVLSDGNILRLARTNAAVFQQAHILAGYIVVVLLFVLGGAFIAARSITRKALHPLESLDLEHADTQQDVYPELQPIVERFAQQQAALNREMRRYKSKKQELKAVTNNMDEGMLFLDPQWHVASLNKSAIKFFGKDKEELLNRSIIELISGEEIRKLLQQMELTGKGRLIINRGSTYYQCNGSRIADKGFVLLIMDVTERTASEKLRREFSANVSHELKTPLTSISGYAEIMMDGLVRQEDMRGFSRRIYNEASRMITLIGDIIRLSKLDEGTIELEKEDVDLYRLIRDIVSRLSVQAEKQNVRIEIVGEHVTFHGIRQVLDEMLYNIIENAVKYNVPNGKVSVWVGNTLNGKKVIVNDTGIGIPKEHQDRIFERFYRVDKSHSRETGGTGLGLSIVKHGALLHGADIHVESEVGKGTRMELIFHEEQNTSECT